MNTQVECIDCQDTGEVLSYTYDHDSHRYVEDGSQKCHCKIKQPDGDGPED